MRFLLFPTVSDYFEWNIIDFRNTGYFSSSLTTSFCNWKNKLREVLCLDQDNPACLGLFGSALVLFVCLLALCGGRKKGGKRMKLMQQTLSCVNLRLDGQEVRSHISSNWTIKKWLRPRLWIRAPHCLWTWEHGLRPASVAWFTSHGRAFGGAWSCECDLIRAWTLPWASRSDFFLLWPRSKDKVLRILQVLIDFSLSLLPGFLHFPLVTICYWQETDFMRGRGWSVLRSVFLYAVSLCVFLCVSLCWVINLPFAISLSCSISHLLNTMRSCPLLGFQCI